MSDERTTEDGDRYFDLEGLARYSGLSVKTLRRRMADPDNPLPSHHVHGSRGRGRTLVSKRKFDAWVAAFPPLVRRRAVANSVPARLAAALARTRNSS